jgi:hypothetical protein
MSLRIKQVLPGHLIALAAVLLDLVSVDGPGRSRPAPAEGR